jgi:uncharacterized phage protein gp47/JayE
MSGRCGCCAACGATSPKRVRNRPGLARVEARAGTHASFLAAMVAGLSERGCSPLEKLTARSPDDASIAMLDAWALVADVLSFYQERIANEAYLRTATERRSLVEIAALVGYRPRPGVAASAHLAFTLENGTDPAEIPQGTRVNSVPGPGEKMVAFETSETIRARREWNLLRPRMTRPQTPESLDKAPGLYLKGTKTGLKPNDPILVRTGAERLRLEFVRSLAENHDRDWTLVQFSDPETEKPGPKPEGRSVHGISLNSLSKPRAVPLPGPASLPRSVERSFSSGADTLPRLLGAVQPALAGTLYQAMRAAPPPPAPAIEVHALRVDARPFGHNAGLELIGMTREGKPNMQEWQLSTGDGDGTAAAREAKAAGHGPRDLYLDNDYDIRVGSLVVILSEGKGPIILGTPEEREREELSLAKVSLSAYGMSGKSVHVHWEPGKGNDKTPVWIERDDTFRKVRETRVFAGSERLELAEAPIEEDLCGDGIELDGVYEGLEPGRWVIVEGERSDVLDVAGKPVPGIRAAELAMLLAVEQSVLPFPPPPPPPAPSAVNPATGGRGQPAAPGPAQKLRTVLKLASQAKGGAGLAYCYKRGTVAIHANVARATHGETRAETLGNGDASSSLQTFVLKQPPLTHVSAATPTGTASTLEVRVNGLLWREARSLAELGPADRAYLTRDDDKGATWVVFGNGSHGARPPTGRENVAASYRSGLGLVGNVPAGRLSLLATRPLGVKGVVNPIRASGGADREDLDSIRRNAPVALMALDRLVSTSDYADFSRAFGGVGKAGTVRASGRDIDVVIAGVADSPIEETSDLVRNLKDALTRFGDPRVTLRIVPRKRLVLILQADVEIDPDRSWSLVEPKIRSALLAEFAFERIAIGEWLPLGRALKAIQAVEGVSYADINVFDSLTEDRIYESFTREVGRTLSCQDFIEVGGDSIAYLAPDVPETLILQERKP